MANVVLGVLAIFALAFVLTAIGKKVEFSGESKIELTAALTAPFAILAIVGIVNIVAT